MKNLNLKKLRALMEKFTWNSKEATKLGKILYNSRDIGELNNNLWNILNKNEKKTVGNIINNLYNETK